IPKRFHASYWFVILLAKSKYENAYGTQILENKLKDIHYEFKEDVKEIFDSLTFYDMDIEKMKKEGLYFGKKYQIQKY
ncbi:MAG: hypothetical protein GY932_15650, partial [Arcobacter sp.]|nr:hypothetical protein [Arcobacter sp.]